jgi:putative DNA primase/helicase
MPDETPTDFCSAAWLVGCLVDAPTEDDRIHRCATSDHPKKRNGSYRTDGRRGWVRNWETGQTVTWQEQQEPQHRGRGRLQPLASLAQRRAQEEAAAHRAACMAQRMITEAKHETHPYLARKGFPKMLGLVHDGLLVVPARLYGAVVSLQQISADGTKKNLARGRMAGASFSMGFGAVEVLCEGYATALSIKAALSAMHLPARVTTCFSAANVMEVAKYRRHAVIMADHDRPVAQFAGLGTGEHYARRTARPWIMPPQEGTDANDLHLSGGLPALQSLLLKLIEEEFQSHSAATHGQK